MVMIRFGEHRFRATMAGWDSDASDVRMRLSFPSVGGEGCWASGPCGVGSSHHTRERREKLVFFGRKRELKIEKRKR